jgi:Jacalin-like lectin domain
VKVRVRHGSRIDAVGLSYELNGKVVDMPMHGGSGGSLTEFNIASGDYIVGISGTYAAKVDSLIIQTNNNQYSVRYGGTGGSASYCYTLSPNLEMVGFLGRSGSEIDAIGCVFRPKS